MSRIGNKPITVPEGIDVTLNGKVITVKGPKGTLTREITSPITVAIDGKEIKVENRLELEQIIREKIRLEYKNIPYWIQVQLDFLI